MAKTNVKRWDDEKLDREIAFAKAALDFNDRRTVRWLRDLVFEEGSRKKLPVYKPGQIMRLAKAGKIADPQPKGEGIIMCQAKGHRDDTDTESPTFWENGSYFYCTRCRRTALARIQFRNFVIDLRGERKKYPLFMKGD